MFPLPTSTTTDYSARASIVEGYNDNVVQLTPGPGQEGERRPSPFTVLELSLVREDFGARSEQSLTLSLRGQHYTPTGAPVGGDDGAGLIAYRGMWDTSAVDTFSFGQSVLVADQNAARLYDAPLAGLDPFIGRSTWAFSTTDLSFGHDIDARNHVRVSAGSEIRAVLEDNSPTAPPAGLDYASPRVSTGYRYTLGDRDALETSVELRYYYTPQALLDIQGDRGARSSLQALPLEMWTHSLGETWSLAAYGGVTVVSGVADRGLTVAPTFGSQLLYAEERSYFELTYGLGFTSIAAGLAPGYSQSAGARFGGRLSRTGWGARFAFVFTAVAARSDTPVSANSSFVIESGGAGVQGHYALTNVIGLVAGYDGRINRIEQTNTGIAPTDFVRNLVFAGLSVSLSSNPAEIPIDVGSPPIRP